MISMLVSTGAYGLGRLITTAKNRKIKITRVVISYRASSNGVANLDR